MCNTSFLGVVRQFEVEQHYFKNKQEILCKEKDLDSGNIRYFHILKLGKKNFQEEFETLISEKEFLSRKKESIKSEKIYKLSTNNGLKIESYDNCLILFEESINNILVSLDIKKILLKEVPSFLTNQFY